jgi:adenine-specific DNA-methyltransferase
MAGTKMDAVGEQPEKLDLRSLDIAADRRAELLRLFPEVHTEGGKIDFERLRAALGETIDTGRERYGLTWPGKAACATTIQAPSMGTLLPVPGESVNFDTTENLIIEGDNLEVLKLLQKSYLGQVKMIYIDPPYNTGNDFIYPDNFGENLKTYLQYTGQADAEGRRFGTNTEADGRFHSKWLNMMYPRLFLARNLLREDGVIFVSIDDHEIENARRLLNEIFGEENFVNAVVWEKIYTTKNDSTLISGCHDYVLVYARSITDCDLGALPRSNEMDARYTNSDNDPRGPWKPIPMYADGERRTGRFTIVGPTGRKFEPPKESHWRYVEADVNKLIADQRVSFGKDGSGQPNLKRFLSELKDGVKSKTLWFHKDVGSNDTANREIKELFEGDDGLFSFPKPTTLLGRMLQLGADANDAVILDFFGGSGTTAHGVLVANKQDGGTRKFVVVQLPEQTGRTDYPTIADITKERVRRVIKKLDAEDAGKLDLDGKAKQDRGFRVFKLAESNLLGWDGSASKDVAALEKQLEMHIDHLRQGRTDQDLLYELLLKSGYKLTDKVVAKTLEGKTVYDIADGGLMICLDRAVTLELIRAMADEKPTNVVCLDAGFDKNDQLKANAVLTFKSKGVTSFRTV